MVLLLASVFCLRQTQVFTSEPELVVLVLSKYGHSAFNHLCWVPVRVGVGCANLSPLGNSDAHVGNSFILPDILSCSFSSRGRC